MINILKQKSRLTLGVISDTHGSLVPAIHKTFQGADLILHAGDIDSPEVIERLNHIAPVVAVRGNMDFGGWSHKLPKSDLIEVGQIYLYMLHNLEALDLDPGAADIQVVISGHTHHPSNQEVNGVLYLNPGSACYPRRNQPPSVARLHINHQSIKSEIMYLEEK
jgi:putative phosphoesterase